MGLLKCAAQTKNIQFTSVTYGILQQRNAVLLPATGTPQTHSRGGLSSIPYIYIYRYIYIEKYTSLCMKRAAKSFYTFHLFTSKQRKKFLLCEIHKTCASW